MKTVSSVSMCPRASRIAKPLPRPASVRTLAPDSAASRAVASLEEPSMTTDLGRVLEGLRNDVTDGRGFVLGGNNNGELGAERLAFLDCHGVGYFFFAGNELGNAS